MGLLDGDLGVGGYGLLGALGAMAPALGYTKMPTTGLQSLALAAGGYGNGALEGAKIGLFNQEGQKNQIANLAAIQRMNIVNNALYGTPMPGMIQRPATPPGFTSLGGTGSTPASFSPTVQSALADVIGQAAPAPGSTSALPGQSPAPAAPQPTAQPMNQGVGLTPAGNATMRDAIVNDFLFPGSGKDIISKAYPGPTDAQRALAAAQVDPNSPLGRQLLAQAAYKAAGIDPVINAREGSTVAGFDPRTGTYTPLFQAPKLPEGMLFNPATGTATPVPGVNEQIARQAAIQQGAIGARERNVKAFDNALEFGNLGAAGGGASVGGFNVGGRFAPPAAAPVAAPAMAPQGQRPGVDTPLPTQHGTLIPPVREQAPINPAGAYLKKALPDWAETEQSWSAALPSLQAAEVQLGAIADALKQTESGEFATNKAALAAKLKAVGINLPTETWGDPAKVQIALKNNAVSTLNQLKGVTNRFTQMEFDRLSKSLANPDLQPEANLSILSEGLGQVRSAQSLTMDWADAKANGWQNPIDFQRAWTKANPTQQFVDQAKEQIGPLKGMVKPIDQNTMSAAQNAIMKGAPRDKVIQRLKEAGYDVSKF